MQEYLAKLRSKPKRVRERIAFMGALGITGSIALGWAAVMVVTNPFALEGARVADGDSISETYEKSHASFSNLLGAAAAAGAGERQEDGIRVVDAQASSTAPAPTVIPF